MSPYIFKMQQFLGLENNYMLARSYFANYACYHYVHFKGFPQNEQKQGLKEIQPNPIILFYNLVEYRFLF